MRTNKAERLISIEQQARMHMVLDGLQRLAKDFTQYQLEQYLRSVR